MPTKLRTPLVELVCQREAKGNDISDHETLLDFSGKLPVAALNSTSAATCPCPKISAKDAKGPAWRWRQVCP